MLSHDRGKQPTGTRVSSVHLLLDNPALTLHCTLSVPAFTCTSNSTLAAHADVAELRPGNRGLLLRPVHVLYFQRVGAHSNDQYFRCPFKTVVVGSRRK